MQEYGLRQDCVSSKKSGENGILNFLFLKYFIIKNVIQMIIGPIVELELPKHNDVLPEEYFNDENSFSNSFIALKKYFH